VLLRELLGADERATRKAAAAAIIRIADRSYLEALINALADAPDADSQAAVVAALRTLTGQRHSADATRWRDWLAVARIPFARS
jgi:HEAT repeat protein